jgi:hypothetical protein
MDASDDEAVINNLKVVIYEMKSPISHIVAH